MYLKEVPKEITKQPTCVNVSLRMLTCDLGTEKAYIMTIYNKLTCINISFSASSHLSWHDNYVPTELFIPSAHVIIGLYTTLV